MEDTGLFNSETLLGDLGGCGKFQVLITTLLQLSAIPMFFGANISPFNVYNPGWKCVGNDTSSISTTTSPTSSSSLATTAAASTIADTETNVTIDGTTELEKMWTEYGRYSCQAFEACPRVEFSPDASTVLTEWGLACSRGWIFSTILAIGSAGFLCSTLIVGYVGDHFGRRLPYIASRVIVTSLSLATIYCKTWQMYAAISFLMGFFGAYALLGLTIMTEYVSPDWRIKLYSIPVWTIIAMVFSIVCKFFPDWKTLNLIVVVSGAISLIPMFAYVPESLRWISVNGKKENLIKLISKIAKVNKSAMPSDDKIQNMIDKNELEEKKPTYTTIDLFRKGYRVPTLILGFVSFVLQVIYFAFSFGIAALPGNFFTNLFIFAVTDLPANILAFFFANRFDRKPSMVTNFGCCSLSIFGIVAIDLLGTGDLKLYGTVVLVMVAKLFTYIGWIVMSTSQIEIYPTVVRSTVNGFTSFFSSLGGIVAPYLIPTDPNTYYINYLIMAFLSLACTGILLFLPETKDQPLKDRWDDEKVAPVDKLEVSTIDSYDKKPVKRDDNLVV